MVEIRRGVEGLQATLRLRGVFGDGIEFDGLVGKKYRISCLVDHSEVRA